MAAAWAVTSRHTGRKTAKVPTLVGVPQQVAKARARSRGFALRVDAEASQQLPGLVLRQSPEPGAILSEGSTIDFVVSLGKPVIGVPNVVGLHAKGAARVIKVLHLVPVKQVVQSNRPANTVITQNPTVGLRVAKGSQVFLTISRGPQFVVVPPLRGATQQKAIAKVQAAGLVPTIRLVNAPERAGTVVAQAPPRQKKVKRGTRVYINVSRGTGLVAVPNLVGTTRAKAQQRVRSLGLVPVVVLVASGAKPETVVAQNPPVRSQVPKGTKVRLRVSKGAATTAKKPKP